MVPRADGNGAEVGGVSQDVMDLFSSRAVAVTGELDRLAREYQAVHGKPPSRRTLWLLHQQAGQNTRRTKAQARRTIAGQTGAAEPTAAQRLAAWEAQTARREVHALSAVHEQVAAFAAERAGRAPAVLDDAAKRTAARIAVAEVQKQHAVWSMAQLRFEVHRALPVLQPGADGEAVVDEVARLAVCGRAGTEVVQVTAPDLTDVTSLGVRASDGGSIYRPPNEERYCTLAHLDTEEQILAAAKRTVPQLVSREQARAAVERTGLNAEQRDAVVMMLTAAAATTVLIAPAGAGKSHTMAEFARLWTTFTGRRVIGLTTSTNAARVLAHEGLAESYNIAAVPRQDRRLRRAAPARPAAPGRRARPGRGQPARHRRPGHDRRGGPAGRSPDHRHRRHRPARRRRSRRHVPAAGPGSPRRASCTRSAGSTRPGNGRPASGSATATWPRSPPTTGTAGSAAPTTKPPTTAPPRCGSPTTCAARTCCCSPDPTPKPPSYPAASRPSSPRSAPSGRRRPPLSDGNHAGVGDLVRARLNTEIDAGGRQLTNRDTLQITAFRGPDAEVRRQRLDGTWTGTFRVPRAYLAGQRRARLRRQRPRRPGPHRRHRPPPRHRHRCPGRPCTSA